MHDFETTERFVKKLSLDYETGCWNWTGYRDECGYGRFYLSGITHNAHRICWEIYNSKIPDKMCVCHACDNPSCCNPNHLWLGTQKQNIEDCCTKNRQKGPKSMIGISHPAAKLTESDVINIRAKYATGEIQSKLAIEYGVSQTAIYLIITHRTWKHIP